MKNIMEVAKWNRFIWFKTQCGCNSDEHIQNLSLELIKDTDTISLDLSSRIHTSCDAVYNDNDSKIKEYWLRIKLAVKFLWYGYLETQESFLFVGKEQIEDYIEGLRSGIKALEKEERDIKSKKKRRKKTWLTEKP